MPLTPDQVRLRLEHAFRATQRLDSDTSDTDGVYRAVHMLIGLLEEILPDLVALATQAQRPESQPGDTVRCGGMEDIETRTVHGITYEHMVHRACPDCAEGYPCARVKMLIGMD